MRNLENSLEAEHPAGKHGQPGNVRCFLASLIECLKAQADAQEGGSSSQRAAQGLQQPALLEGPHHGAEVSLPRKNDLGGGTQRFGRVHHLGRVAEVPDGFQD